MRLESHHILNQRDHRELSNTKISVVSLVCKVPSKAKIEPNLVFLSGLSEACTLRMRTSRARSLPR